MPAATPESPVTTPESPFSASKVNLPSSFAAKKGSKWLKLAVMTPAKVRKKVQARFEKIIASEVAGTRSSLVIEDALVSVHFEGFKGAVEKWLIPRAAMQAFLSVSYEVIMGVGEWDLVTKGVDAYDKLGEEEVRERELTRVRL